MDSRVAARWRAIVITALALGLLNVGLAGLIVAAIGGPTFPPAWLAAASLIVGLLAAVAAVVLWRRYLAQARRRYS